MCVVLVCTCGSVGHASDARLDEQRTEFKEGQMPDLIIRKAGGGPGSQRLGKDPLWCWEGGEAGARQRDIPRCHQQYYISVHALARHANHQHTSQRVSQNTYLVNVRRYSLTLYTAAHCTPRLKKHSRNTRKARKKKQLQEDSIRRIRKNAQYYRKLHRAKGAMHSISTKDNPVQIYVYKGFFLRGERLQD